MSNQKGYGENAITLYFVRKVYYAPVWKQIVGQDHLIGREKIKMTEFDILAQIMLIQGRKGAVPIEQAVDLDGIFQNNVL